MHLFQSFSKKACFYLQLFCVGCFQDLMLFLYCLLKPSNGWTVLYNNTEEDSGDFIERIKVVALSLSLGAVVNNNCLKEFKDVGTISASISQPSNRICIAILLFTLTPDLWLFTFIFSSCVMV